MSSVYPLISLKKEIIYASLRMPSCNLLDQFNIDHRILWVIIIKKFHEIYKKELFLFLYRLIVLLAFAL